MIKYFILLLLAGCMFQDIFAQENESGWWPSTTVYQIYPRSYYDTDGDGLGDLKGIIEKLDYIKSLGFETIWISPFFQSPQQDFGYDISDYYAIAPEYGDMQLCEQLINEVHQRDMKVVFDLVMNHTSDQHEWFKESASSKDNPKADWYVWKDGKGKNGLEPPNNWKSMIGGNGWHYHEGREQFYWASFLPFQPDLNYYNPEVREAMLDVARFWLAKGVDGFRLDIFNAIYEDSSFRDNPFSFQIIPSEENPDGFFQEAKYNINQPESFEFATELRKVVDEFEGRFMVGEVFGDAETLKKFCQYKGEDGLHTVFLFKTLTTPFKAEDWLEMVTEFEAKFPEPFVPTYVFSNHDRRRSISVLDNDVRKAKLLALFQLTVRGIPFTYYGEELGIPKPTIPLDEGKDPLAQRYDWLPQFLVNMTGESLNRDECRTPMLWDGSANAGFCPKGVQPWLPVSKNYEEINVAEQEKNPNSLMNFYKQVIQLRNETEAFQKGSLQIADKYCSKDVFAFYRILNDRKYLVLMNFSKKEVELAGLEGKVSLSTHENSKAQQLEGLEGKVVKISL